MEISFVLSAMRRYWWVVAIFVEVGFVPLLVSDNRESTYESTAVLLVSPPSESRVQVSFTNDPDRYVIGQLAVLESATLRAAVADRLAGDATAASIGEAVTIRHSPETDIVHVTAAASNPDDAAALADAYVDTYLASLDEQVAQAQSPELAELSQRLEDIGQQLDAVDTAIGAAMAPYLELVGNPDAGPIPSVEQVAPNLVSQKTTLLTEYGEILSLSTQLEISSKLRVTSQLVQGASQAVEVPASGRAPLLLAPLVGLLLGACTAVVLARNSPIVYDEDQVSRILGAPTTTCPRMSFSDDPTATLDHLPAPLVPVVDRLCVAAEAAGKPGHSISIVVSGTQRVAGATTIAAAMAGRFAAGGATVLLVDANVQNPELSRRRAPNARGLSCMDQDGPVGRSPHPLVTVVGIGGVADVHHLRRQQVPALVTAAAERADVVVFDAGSLEHNVAAVQLMRLADVVMVAVPARGQRIDELEMTAEHLRSFSAQVLAVVVPTHRRSKPDVPRDPVATAPAEPAPDLARTGAAPATP